MRKAAPALACLVTLAAATGTSYAHQVGHTTEDHMATGGPAIKGTYKSLVEGPGTPRAFPASPVAPASLIAGRESRRRSIAYFAQLTDFQLADEESPARVEFLDSDPSNTASSSHRPMEAFEPWAIDYSFRQLNQFTAASPHRQGDGSRAAMDFGLITGDNSDNQQRNETEWVRRLIEGGQPLSTNSGKATFANTSCSPADQTALAAKYPDLAAEAAAYTGVQDYSDYFVAGDYYDPDMPTGGFADFPRYPGLMDRAQIGFMPVGLRRGGTPVPTYLTNGNHDGLVQGNEDAIKAIEDIAVGCVKPLTTTSSAPMPGPGALLSAGLSAFVPPDDQRQFVDRVQLKQIYRSGIQADGHGFDLIDPQENQASGFAATYYAADLKPGIRFISIDTVAEGGATGDSDEGNIDDPQFRWIQRELAAARAAGKLVVLFGHHPTRRLVATRVADEAAQPCTGRYSADQEGAYDGQQPRFQHDPNPGCDLDPRLSTPLHGTADLQALFDANPNVIAYVAGHTHENELRGCGRPEGEGCKAGGNWWEINTSSGADWPQQHRLVEVMDNGDGTLSLLTTALEHASSLGIPAENASAAGFGDETLASLARSFAFNDPQKDVDAEQVNEEGAIGDAADRNAELVVDDPRTNVIRGTDRDDVLVGTPGDDLIFCGAGDDVVRAGGGNDVVRCGSGDDVVLGEGGNDQLFGESGNDRLLGGAGNDRLVGASGQDRLFGQRGRDRLSGGRGLDRHSGGSGSDRIAGGAGGDFMNGGGGRDTLSGNSGNDRIAGGPGGDRAAGGRGRDRIAGESGNDRLSGNSGRDLLYGGKGSDRLFGGSGNDRLIGGRGRDRLSGGPGRDTRRR